jgi:hypothetical protein
MLLESEIPDASGATDIETVVGGGGTGLEGLGADVLKGTGGEGPALEVSVVGKDLDGAYALSTAPGRWSVVSSSSSSSSSAVRTVSNQFVSCSDMSRGKRRACEQHPKRFIEWIPGVRGWTVIRPAVKYRRMMAGTQTRLMVAMKRGEKRCCLGLNGGQGESEGRRGREPMVQV